eukprot:Rmarinus@m.21724
MAGRTLSQSWQKNNIGSSEPSPPSEPVVPGSAPYPPTSVLASATGEEGEVIVEFDPPARTGGSSVTHYTVTVYPGERTIQTEYSPVVVDDLNEDISYHFVVTATNRLGESEPSNPSREVKPTCESEVCVSKKKQDQRREKRRTPRDFDEL